MLWQKTCEQLSQHLALYGAQGDALTPALDADATEAHIARSSAKPSAKLSARLK